MNKDRILEILESAKDKNDDVPMNLVRKAFEKMPSAESEIIRCRNCKYYISGSDDVRYCFNHDDDILWQDDDFCSRAERREE